MALGCGFFGAFAPPQITRTGTATLRFSRSCFLNAADLVAGPVSAPGGPGQCAIVKWIQGIAANSCQGKRSFRPSVQRFQLFDIQRFIPNRYVIHQTSKVSRSSAAIIFRQSPFRKALLLRLDTPSLAWLAKSEAPPTDLGYLYGLHC